MELRAGWGREMTRIEKSIEVQRPSADVWGLFADFAGVDDWHPYMESAHIEGELTEGVGAARICAFGPKMAIRETVVEWGDRQMVIAIDFVKGMAPPMRDIRASVVVTPLDDGDTRCDLKLTMQYQTTLGPIGWLADKLMITRQYKGVFDDMLAAAKGQSEAGDPGPQIAMPGSGRVLAAS